MLSRRVLAVAVAAMLLPASVSAQDAQSFPEKSIRYVLNASPGGGTDIMARKLQQALEKELGQTVVIENRPGGGSATQMAEVTKARADGYTIGSVTGSHIGAFNQTLRQYNVDSVEWVAGLLSEAYVLAVPADGEIQSLADIVARVNESGQDLVIGGFTRGSGGHVTWEMFADAAKLRPQASRWVPYDSVGDAVTAVLGKHVDAVVAYADLVEPHVEAGTLKVIGVLSDKRLPTLPEGPTFAEQGFDLDTGWQQFRGVIAPKGVPMAIQEKLAGAFERALKSPEMIAYMEESSLAETFMGPAEFGPYAREQDKITKEWMQRLGLSQ